MSWGSPRMLVAFMVGTLATVGLLVVLVTGSWWALPVAMAGHIAAAVLVMRPTARSLAQQEKPDPLDEARFEEEGRGPTGDGPAQPSEDREGVDGTAPEDERRMAI